jgi:mono/diheme cytochrome c family protein
MRRDFHPHPATRLLAALLLFCAALTVNAAELTLDLGHGARRLETAQLLARSDVREIEVPGDVAYLRTMHYRAVPLKALLDGVQPGDHLQIVALDGFAAEIDAAPILDGHGAQAWLAIEDPAAPWPPLGQGKPGAGPFYLVWKHPEAAHINPEQWPFQIAAIRRLDAVETRFPALLPDAKLPPTAPAWRGFAVFRTHCLACHTLNGAGDARLGPDLNLPHNPTEYFRADFLRAYIRDPQSMRRWPQAKMPPSTLASLSDAELDDLLAYLRHMAGRKTTQSREPPHE